MERYLVTGGAGFIGSHIVSALLARGARVRVLDDLSSGNEANLPGRGTNDRFELVQGDIADARACREACHGIDRIFHQAAQVSVPRSIEDPERSYAVNVMGTLRLLEAARAAGVRRVVFAASSAAYGNTPPLPKVENMVPDPLSPYAAGKVAAEHLMRVFGTVHGMRTVSLRYFNVYGPRQADDSPYTGVIAIFARNSSRNGSPRLGDGLQTRDFTYVEDVVDANLRAMSADLSLGRSTSGAASRTSLLDLLRAMAAIMGRQAEPSFAPVRAGDVRDSLASVELARALLGWKPHTGLQAGLTSTLDWYRERLTRV